MKAAALVLSVLTLNVSGPRRVLQGWQSRRAALAARLKTEDPDVAAFQELWRPEDLAFLGDAAGYKGRVQDERLGLAVASRYALVAPSSADLGWGGGALRARLSVAGKEADVYAARLTPGADAPSAARRLAQLVDLAAFVRSSSTGPFVLLGDLAGSPDEPEVKLFLDLLGARDLCVTHGDEACGRTKGDARVDYALIPYAARPPRENARAAFTDATLDDDDLRPLAARFGLAARLDDAWLKSAPAREPDGRLEALATAADALDAARAEAEKKVLAAGWTPWRGALESAQSRTEAERLAAAAERARTAIARETKPVAPASE